MDYETFGEHQNASTGIFDFMRYLPEVILKDGSFEFVTPSQAAKKHKAIAPLEVPDAISWADEERDVTAWLGNELQQDAFNKLYAQTERLSLVNDPVLWEDFGHLQESDHFYYMCTKFFSDGEVHKDFHPYNTPYEAVINYMNVLSDFIIRIDDAFAVSSPPGNPPVKPAAKAASTEKTARGKAAGKAAPAKKPSARKTAKKKK